MRRQLSTYAVAALLPLVLLSVSCSTDVCEQVLSAADEGMCPIEFSLASQDCSTTKSTMSLTATTSVGEGTCSDFEVSRTPMDGVKGTKAFTPVTTDSCNLLYVEILDSVNKVVRHNEKFVRGEDGVFRSGMYWPTGYSSLKFLVSNMKIDTVKNGGSDPYLDISDNSKDIVAGTFTAYPREQGSVSLEHVFASVGKFDLNYPEGHDGEIISAPLRAYVRGKWSFFDQNLSGEGELHTFDLSTDSNFLCVGGDLWLNVKYTLSFGESLRTVETLGRVDLERGMINNINVNTKAHYRYSLRKEYKFKMGDGQMDSQDTVSVSTGCITGIKTYRCIEFVSPYGDVQLCNKVEVTKNCTWKVPYNDNLLWYSGCYEVEQEGYYQWFSAGFESDTITATVSYEDLSGFCFFKVNDPPFDP